MWIKLKRIEQSGTVVRTEKAQQFKVPLQSVVHCDPYLSSLSIFLLTKAIIATSTKTDTDTMSFRAVLSDAKPVTADIASKINISL
jgi:hypothetical protein